MFDNSYADNNNDRSSASQEERRGGRERRGGESSSSSPNQVNDYDDHDNNNNNSNDNFSFKYTESGGLTARYLLISFDSNTNTLSSSTDISGSNLSQKTVPDSERQESENNSIYLN